MSRSLDTTAILERHLRAAEDADFQSAALRRRFLALLSGPVRHVELTTGQAAKLLACDEAALGHQLDQMTASKKLRVRRFHDGHGGALVSAYSLPGERLPRLGEGPGPKTGVRSILQRVRTRQPIGGMAAKLHAEREQRLAACLALAVKLERVGAPDVQASLRCSYSTAWSLLTELEQGGKVVSAMEPVPGKNARRFYRVVTA